MTENELIKLVQQVLQPSIMLSVAGALISLACTYIPGFRERFATLSPSKKASIQGLSITVLTVILGITSWTGILVVVQPNKMGVFILIFSLISSLIANQSTYTLTKDSKPASVKSISNKTYGLLG